MRELIDGVLTDTMFELSGAPLTILYSRVQSGTDDSSEAASYEVLQPWCLVFPTRLRVYAKKTPAFMRREVNTRSNERCLIFLFFFFSSKGE